MQVVDQSRDDNTWERTLDIQEEEHGYLMLVCSCLGEVDHGVNGVRCVLAGSTPKLAIWKEFERFGVKGEVLGYA